VRLPDEAVIPLELEATGVAAVAITLEDAGLEATDMDTVELANG